MAASPPPSGDWVVDSVEFDYTWSDPYSDTVTKTIYEHDIGTVVYVVGWRNSQAEQGWATATAECYSNVRPGGNAVQYSFTVGASAGLKSKLNLVATGPRPGRKPSTWKQQAYANSETHHRIQQSGTPSPQWSINWRSEAKAGGVTDWTVDHKTWEDANWFGKWDWLHAQSGWTYQAVDWHGVGSILSRVEVDCGLAEGKITAEVDQWVTSWGSRHDP